MPVTRGIWLKVRGEHTYTSHVFTGARVARQAAVQAKLSPTVRFLHFPRFWAIVRNGSRVVSAE